MSDKKIDISDRVTELEKKIDILMSMLNHINKILSDKVIEKIELDFEEAVKNKLNQND
jgi:hypothetical protein